MIKLVTILASCALAITPISAFAKEMKVAHFAPEGWAASQIDKWFGAELAKRTNGETKLTFFWSGSLGKGNEIIYLVANGGADAGVTGPAYYPSEMPLTGMINSVPFVFSDAAVAMGIQDKLSRNNANFLAEYKRVGVFPILQHGLNPYRLQCTKPVKTLSDLKGLKVRTYGSYIPVMFETIGMIPVNMGLGAIYEGLQRGVIDCASLNNEVAGVLKLWEVAPYWSSINLGAFSGPAMFVPWKNYKSGGWSPDFVELVDKIAAEAFALEQKDLAKNEKIWRVRASEKGANYIEFVDQDKLAALVPDMLEVWRKKQIGNGLDKSIATSIISEVKAAIGE